MRPQREKCSECKGELDWWEAGICRLCLAELRQDRRTLLALRHPGIDAEEIEMDTPRPAA